jgi:hypothetical protein
MRQVTPILLIGIIFTVGFSIAGGVGIADVSAADTAESPLDATETNTSIDTQTTPGEVTNTTSQNPNPGENRGAFAGVTPYTIADDVLGGVGNDCHLSR